MTDVWMLAEMSRRAITALLHHHLREVADAAWPSSSDSAPVSGGGTSDPTGSRSLRDRPTQPQRALTRVWQILESEVAKTKPRMPDGACQCCQLDTATHGDEMRLCYRCWTYERKWGVRCDAATHDGRPRPARGCECSGWCCRDEVCLRRAREGSSVCEQCETNRQES